MDEKRELTETSLPAPKTCGVEEEPAAPKLECAICLQKCIHPAKLPCGHIFCFLCVKGIANQSKRCAMCRQEIPADFTEKPELIPDPESEQESPTEESYRWFYEGRNGWWQYDERTSGELEAACAKQERRCEVLIAGFLYIVDFEHMIQVRRNDISRRRRVKRDLASVPKKGIAGIRLEGPARGGAANSDMPTCATSEQCNASEQTHGCASRSDLESVNEGTSGGNTVQYDRIYSESVADRVAALPNDPSDGGGDRSSLLSEEDEEELSMTIAILEGTAIDALHLDSNEMGSGDTFSEPSYRMSRVGRRRYYEDNL
uniref:E3 ubiquitin-protein ligase n=1 Tax=Amblyomma aureolatum TaxID=187763 RepID=A0A1E1X3S9_9ACAR